MHYWLLIHTQLLILSKALFKPRPLLQKRLIYKLSLGSLYIFNQPYFINSLDFEISSQCSKTICAHSHGLSGTIWQRTLAVETTEVAGKGTGLSHAVFAV